MRLRRKRAKIFVIGRNKTGTTSMGQTLTSFGFRLGKQSQAELLIEDWGKLDFRRIIKYCKTTQSLRHAPLPPITLTLNIASS